MVGDKTQIIITITLAPTGLPHTAVNRIAYNNINRLINILRKRFDTHINSQPSCMCV